MRVSRRILYVAVPAVAFALVLSNALFGHLVVIGDAEQVANRYSVYVHLQPGWESHPRNIIFEVTNSWHKRPGGGDGGSGGAQGATYNDNRLLSAGGRDYVELRHGFSECRDEWQPILYRRAIDAVRHEIEYLQGGQLGIDPSVSVYPNVPGEARGPDEGGAPARPGYAQFIPVCTSARSATYEYSVRTDDAGIGVDAYFVPSPSQRDAYYGGGSGGGSGGGNGGIFEPYDAPGCSASNMRSFSGVCRGVAPGGGLLLVLPDALAQPVTKVTVNLYERPP